MAIKNFMVGVLIFEKLFANPWAYFRFACIFIHVSFLRLKTRAISVKLK